MVSTEPTLATPEATGRQRILRAARALFTANGYATVSMQQIADAAAVNKATLYHHFRDKEDLFVAVMIEEFARTTADVAAVIAKGVTLREQLTQVAEYLFVARQSDFGRLSADLHDHLSEQRRAEMMSRCAPPWEHIRTAIDRAITRGEVEADDTELVARLFFAMVGSQLWWRKFTAGRPAPDARLAATIVDLLLDGIGTRGGNP
jgi:AcrR family transcriptional regulator